MADAIHRQGPQVRKQGFQILGGSNRNALVITSAGLDRMIHPDQSGTDAVRITSCKFGTGKWIPSKDATELRAPFSWSLATVAGGAVAGNQIHIEVTDGSDRSYAAYEAGLYDSDGVLIAIASPSSLRSEAHTPGSV